jgi:HlyD family secretion protein
VSYGVVVDADNRNQKLLPGMTATIDFVIERASEVLMVANSALRFRPDAALIRERGVGDTAAASQRAPRDTIAYGRAARGGTAPSPADRSDARAVLWFIDPNDRLASVRVRTGLTNGQYTEIESDSPVVREGLRVIASVVAVAAATSSSNPFQQAQPRGGGPGGGPPGGRGGRF